MHALKGMDKLFLLTPTHPKMSDFTSNLIYLPTPKFLYAKLCQSIFLPAGQGKASFVDVRHIAAIAVQALTNNKDNQHSGKAYTITGPQAVSYGEAAEILSEYLDRKVSYVDIS